MTITAEIYLVNFSKRDLWHEIILASDYIKGLSLYSKSRLM